MKFTRSRCKIHDNLLSPLGRFIVIFLVWALYYVVLVHVPALLFAGSR